MTVHSYTRVSTARQAEEGESPEVQRRQIDGYAMIHGLAVEHHWYDDGVSGSIPLADRPQGSQMLSRLVSGDVVIVPKIDRAFRSSLDALSNLEAFRKRGIALHVVDLNGDVLSNGHAKLVFSILAAVAESERDMIRNRIRDVKRVQAARNRYLGGALPWGYRKTDDDCVEPEPWLPNAINQIKAGRDAGLSLREIASTLADANIMISLPTIAKVARGSYPLINE